MGLFFQWYLPRFFIHYITVSLRKRGGLSSGFNQNVNLWQTEGCYSRSLCIEMNIIYSSCSEVERFIGRVREWSILNAVWPVLRMDLAGNVSYCRFNNVSYWPKRKQTKYWRWFINQSCFFIKLITADYKLKYNITSALYVTKPAKGVLLHFTLRTQLLRNWLNARARMCDHRGLILVKCGIRLATFSPKRL